MSYGTGPAAAIGVGGILYMAGEHVFGTVLMVAGIVMSLAFSLR